MNLTSLLALTCDKPFFRCVLFHVLTTIYRPQSSAYGIRDRPPTPPYAIGSGRCIRGVCTCAGYPIDGTQHTKELIESAQRQQLGQCANRSTVVLTISLFSFLNSDKGTVAHQHRQDYNVV